MFSLVFPSDAASITASSPNVIFVEGNNVTLHCNATGNPPPNITWTTYNNRKVYGENLKIEKIDRRDAGNYICTAWNGIGSNYTYTFTIIVHCKFNILRVRCHVMQWTMISDSKLHLS